jgi:tetratricopeptide (TPR) repeat protein
LEGWKKGKRMMVRSVISYVTHGNRWKCFLLLCSLSVSSLYAQFNTDRLVTIGRSALYYEDYVLSIQYFNQIILAKPYLYEPWFYRGVAKFYLDDYRGAEADCSEAISRNPYVVGMYELRGLCRIRQEKYGDAIADYNAALRYEPENITLWHNRALCHIQQKDYDTALAEIDSMQQRWSKNAQVYALQAEALILKKDTTQAIAALTKSLEIDAYNGNTWAQRAIISLSRSEWKESEGYLDKAIHLLPRQARLYINRALARFNQNNLRGAMADYDMALDYEPNNFLGHYNRGLLRAQVGDDNRAITDFDFVLKLEPDNLMALYNRALLLEQTGNPRAAIRDYSKVIEQYPNFWTGLYQRAACYRKLGMNKQAEQDEFRILKAQIDKRYGKQPRLSKTQMRKRSDEDIEKYNQLAVADEQEMENEYQSEYRGKVQNRRVGMDYQPMYTLVTEGQSQSVRNYLAYDSRVDSLNGLLPSDSQVYIRCSQVSLDEKDTRRYFSRIDTLSLQLDASLSADRRKMLLLQRALAYSVIQNYESAIDDLSLCLQQDSLLVEAYWLRAVSQSRLNDFNASQGTDVRMKTANVLADLTQALSVHESAYLYYNRGNVYVQRNDLPHAIDDYTRSIQQDANLAEAYYNRGLALLASHRDAEGIADLSKAGELGLYSAYSIIKRHQK